MKLARFIPLPAALVSQGCTEVGYKAVRYASVAPLDRLPAPGGPSSVSTHPAAGFRLTAYLDLHTSLAVLSTLYTPSAGKSTP